MKNIISLIESMIKMGLLDRNRLNDTDYVLERLAIYIEAKKFVDTNLKNCF